ncbi:MAG: 2-C-methyl-D-erythritol 2,4-cyclodiphosphate synthase [Oscillospiraceae bacterium]|nr:2-C-methyl-D-erythritol 2,4-cyclodiphosphate synthase [Oscillospiraceae bacterium]
MFRIGNGYDVHRFEKGRKLIIGGVDIEYGLGLAGHSDADVLIHAVADALLGAAAFGDIGKHFPPTDPQYKNADSLLLLEKVVTLLEQNGFSVGNIDTIIIAERPKLSIYTDKMRENISRICKISTDRVSVKATTEEGLGLGGEGIGAHCSALILENSKEKSEK